MKVKHLPTAVKIKAYGKVWIVTDHWDDGPHLGFSGSARIAVEYGTGAIIKLSEEADLEVSLVEV